MANKSTIARSVAEQLRMGEGPTRAFDIALDAVGPGHAVVSMVLGPDTLNGHGNAHGGILFLLADTAFAYACNSRNVATVCQSATIAFLSPGRAGERITADALEIALAGRSGSYQVTLCGEDQRIIATFQALSRTTGATVLDTPQQENMHG